MMIVTAGMTTTYSRYLYLWRLPIIICDEHFKTLAAPLPSKDYTDVIILHAVAMYRR